MPKNVYEHHRDIREALPKLIEEVERLNKLNDRLSTDLVNREAVLGATKDERDKVIQNGLNLLTHSYALEKERDQLKAELAKQKEYLSQEMANHLHEQNKTSNSAAERNSELMKERDQLKAEVEKLKELLEASEMFREAYRKGKLKLYSMQGAIAEAAMSHLPCSEGPLERAAAQAVGKRMGWIEQEYGYELVKERDAALARVEKLRESLHDIKLLDPSASRRDEMVLEALATDDKESGE